MPYSKDELQDLPFYQEITAQDESRYLEMIGNKTQDGNVDDGILRDKNSGNSIIFE